jgi:hypothetical protein
MHPAVACLRHNVTTSSSMHGRVIQSSDTLRYALIGPARAVAGIPPILSTKRQGSKLLFANQVTWGTSANIGL